MNLRKKIFGESKALGFLATALHVGFGYMTFKIGIGSLLFLANMSQNLRPSGFPKFSFINGPYY